MTLYLFPLVFFLVATFVRALPLSPSAFKALASVFFFFTGGPPVELGAALF